ncbi:tRNA (N6-threonylcarbamoyladenosine(37)-N6)-methyltransferase TrmO [Stenoxybacter acetivorans]|uniref:tRNA (N6-threonylcarbamoyladenosine(37)-N6)-methyltransferase TrmO n=1 Tax=Stenoxybacter acetivorans TaxID=422441 RepID=UPI00056BEBF2|nr:tRNA (N6-threonylcarbamoyladenosine(37)-N6)-methyltransferase TrmO [Stenoxybacter acetivorans]
MNPNTENFSIAPIGYVQSPYKQKFGVPRQPGLASQTMSCIELLPEFSADCVRGLSEFDYIWVHFVFHKVLTEGWQPLVRPPKLGGKKKVGVFATRSPHRPNHLGLSLLPLVHIDTQQGVKIWVRGGDFIDGTPIIDIKPYLAFIESQAHARSGFARLDTPILTVVWHEQAQQAIHTLRLPEDFVVLIKESIRHDPRPAHQHDEPRRFVMQLAWQGSDYDVVFSVNIQAACVENVLIHTGLKLL